MNVLINLATPTIFPVCQLGMACPVCVCKESLVFAITSAFLWLEQKGGCERSGVQGNILEWLDTAVDLVMSLEAALLLYSGL